MKKIKSIIRGQNLDNLQNNGYDILNGSRRHAFNHHIKKLNPSVINEADPKT